MKQILFASVISIGLILIAISLFAEQIGLDNDAGWGAGRSLVLKGGVVLLLISILAMLFKERLSNLGHGLSKSINKFNSLNYSTQMIVFSLPVTIIVIASYIWFALPAFDTTNFHYYSSLAIAFKQHQLYLIEEPSPGLLALDNPYDYGLRKSSGVDDFPWDVSLYKNKYYLYWGPVPSLALTLFSTGILNHIGDETLVLAFMCALYFYCVLLSYLIWLKFNQTLPPWLFGIVILAIGLSAPATIMLNSSRIYEAAVVGGQFFFIGGCYWVFSYFNDESLRPYKIILAGIHWALALGTRVTVLPVLIFTTVIILVYSIKQRNFFSLKTFLPTLIYLCLPLILVGLGLIWYNWIRFNSTTEFGIKYQLANVDYNVFKDSFSTRYIKENFASYFFHPIKFQEKFPYFQPIENIFTNERLAGLVYTSPYFLFAFLFIGKYLRRKKASSDQKTDTLQGWTMLMFAGSTLISLFTFLSFYFPTTRYGEDFTPPLLILATLSIGQGHMFLDKNKITGKAYVVFVALVSTYSVIASTLVAIPPYRAKFVVIFIKEIYKLLGF